MSWLDYEVTLRGHSSRAGSRHYEGLAERKRASRGTRPIQRAALFSLEKSAAFVQKTELPEPL